MPTSDLLLLLGRLEGKMDALIKSQTLLDQQLQSLSKRVSALERTQAYWGGMAALLGTLLGFCLSWSGQ